MATTTATTTVTKRLSTAVLSSLKNKGVAIPAYDRTQVKAGIVHIGVGNFHRAHMATYLDDLMASHWEQAKDWGIWGAGILHFDQAKRDLLEPQDWLQTVMEQDADSTKPRIIGSMIDFLPVNVQAIQTALENPDIHIVSLTVTEGGYYLAGDGEFNVQHPQIQHDIANPDTPQTVFGVIAKAARYRKEQGLPLFTVLSCDNIVHNGDVVRSVVVGLATAQDAALGAWINDTIGFPNSMVDRITPATSPAQVQFLQETYQYDDAAPIVCEPFRQWILEDTFTNNKRPPLDLLPTVQFVPDVTPYEFMKLRILNGGHASLCYPSALMDLGFVHDSMEHKTVAAFLEALETTEILPTVPPVPDVELVDYWKTIAHRFSNPTLRDTLTRICYDGASRQPKFVVPVIADNVKAGRSVDGMALVSAAWCRYCQGTTESGKEIPSNDPDWDNLQKLAKEAAATQTPLKWLDGLPHVYGSTAQAPAFRQAFEKAFQKIEAEGMEAALQAYITAAAAHSK